MDVPGAEGQRQVRQATERCRVLATQIARLQAELVEAAKAVIELEGFLGGISPAHHLAFECQLTGAEARRVVKLAEQLPTVPDIARAFAEGRLSEGTVDSMASVATPENEAKLLDTAVQANASQLQRLVRTYRRLRDVEDDVAGVRIDERLSFGQQIDGMWHISGRARPDRGAEIEAALRAMFEVDVEHRDAPGEVLRDPRGRRPGENGAPGGMERLVRMARVVIAGSARTRPNSRAVPDQPVNPAPAVPDLLPDRFLTVVHVDERWLRERELTGSRPRGAPEPHVQGGGVLAPTDLDEVLCGSWIAAVVWRNGRPVTATAPQRSAPKAMRTALLARDRGCRLCGSPDFLQPHHIVHSSRGGPTRLSNLVMLCGTCHRRLHRHGWRITGDPDEPPDPGEGARRVNGSRRRRRTRLQFWRRDGSEIPIAALREPLEDPAAAARGLAAARRRPDPDVLAAREPHNGDRLDRYAKDVILSYWLDSPDAA